MAGGSGRSSATVTVGAQQRAPEPARAAAPRAETLRPEILGTHGIVAAGRHYSVSAGVRILQQGGNADRCRRRVGVRGIGLRDLALRLRRRSADDDLRREDAARSS